MPDGFFFFLKTVDSTGILSRASVEAALGSSQPNLYFSASVLPGALDVTIVFSTDIPPSSAIIAVNGL